MQGRQPDNGQYPESERSTQQVEQTGEWLGEGHGAPARKLRPERSFRAAAEAAEVMLGGQQPDEADGSQAFEGLHAQNFQVALA